MLGEDLETGRTSHEQLFWLKMGQHSSRRQWALTEYQFSEDRLHLKYELVPPPRKCPVAQTAPKQLPFKSPAMFP